jgi:hypothetical protein
MLVAVGLLTVGCGPDKPTGSSGAPPASPLAAVGISAPQVSDCRPSPPSDALVAVKGSNLWALVFAPLPIKAGTETKIVWRIGGRGVFSIAAKTTDGTIGRLTFGPTFHDGSSWVIPNTDEWGTGFIFPTPGCWRVHASRADTAGDVYFLVVQALGAG